MSASTRVSARAFRRHPVTRPTAAISQPPVSAVCTRFRDENAALNPSSSARPYFSHAWTTSGMTVGSGE